MGSYLIEHDKVPSCYQSVTWVVYSEDRTKKPIEVNGAEIAENFSKELAMIHKCSIRAGVKNESFVLDANPDGTIVYSSKHRAGDEDDEDVELLTENISQNNRNESWEREGYGISDLNEYGINIWEDGGLE